MPDKNIPELQFLPEHEWNETAGRVTPDAVDGVRKALAELRRTAKKRFAPMMGQALSGI